MEQQRFSWVVCGAALILCAPGAPAQIYRQVDPSGKITFTDRPDPALPAAQVTGIVAARPLQEPPRRAAQAEVASALAENRPMYSRYASTVDLAEAARRLREAWRRLDAGRDPLAGEGTAAAPNERYWRRQEVLRRAVDDAERRLADTEAALLGPARLATFRPPQ